MAYIAEYKEKYVIHNKKKRKETEKLLEKGRELEQDFALNEDDIENIFDILEKEWEWTSFFERDFRPHGS